MIYKEATVDGGGVVSSIVAPYAAGRAMVKFTACGKVHLLEKRGGKQVADRVGIILHGKISDQTRDEEQTDPRQPDLSTSPNTSNNCS